MALFFFSVGDGPADPEGYEFHDADAATREVEAIARDLSKHRLAGVVRMVVARNSVGEIVAECPALWV